MKVVKCILLGVLVLLLGATQLQAQESKQEENKKVIIIKKVVDDEGNVLTENIELDGDDAENMEWTNEDQNVKVRINAEGDIEKRVEVIVAGDDVKHRVLHFENGEEILEDIHVKIREYDVDEEGGERSIRLKLKTDDGEGEVIEWEGNGDIPEEIKEKLKAKGMKMAFFDEDHPFVIQMGEEDMGAFMDDNFEFEFRDGNQFLFQSDDEGDMDMIKEIIILKKTGKIGHSPEDMEVTVGVEESPFGEMESFPETGGAALKVNNFEVFPNPTDGQIQLRFEAEPLPTEIMISDASGKSVYKRSLSNFDGKYSGEIDLKDFPKGTHFLQISQEGKVFTEKIVVQ